MWFKMVAAADFIKIRSCNDIDRLVKRDVTPVLKHWSYISFVLIYQYIDGIVQNCRKTNANALELPQS